MTHAFRILIAAIGLCAWASACAQSQLQRFFYATDGQKHCIQWADSALWHTTAGGDTLSRWHFPYPVFRIELADLNGNGLPEIAVGLVKGTRYYPEPMPHLFIFKLYDGELIRPLWLGSRLTAILDDFSIDRSTSPVTIITREHTPDGRRLRCTYHLGGFGLINDKTDK